MTLLQSLPVVPFLLAVYLGFSGVRKRSLSPSGGIAAFIVGFAMMAVPLRVFGASLIVFYLTGSKATKVGKEIKAKLEDGHQEAGYRNAAQVLCNSLSAFIASLLWSAAFVPDSLSSSLFSWAVSARPGYDFDNWCPLTPPPSARLSRTLLLVTLGYVSTTCEPKVAETLTHNFRHFACCLGDTLASELGILSRSRPRLITTLKPVPPGTNGGVSSFGTFASAAGGTVMGLTMFISLLIQSSHCRAEWYSVGPQLLFWGTCGGLLGSLVGCI